MIWALTSLTEGYKLELKAEDYKSMGFKQIVKSSHSYLHDVVLFEWGWLSCNVLVTF